MLPRMDRYFDWQAVMVTAAAIMAGLNFLADVAPGRRIFNSLKVMRWLGREDKMAESQLVSLAAGDDKNSLLSLKSNELAGQIATAVEPVLDAPHKYGALLNALHRGGDTADTAAYSELAPKGFAIAYDNEKTRATLMALRARITNRIQRRLDNLQIDLKKDWRTTAQLAALLLGFPLARVLNVDENQILGTAIAGGLLAPVMHDLVRAFVEPRTRA